MGGEVTEKWDDEERRGGGAGGELEKIWWGMKKGCKTPLIAI